jgi:uncharacterized membrane protein YkoI
MDGRKLIVGVAAVAVLALGGGATITAQQEDETPITGGTITAPAGSNQEDEATEEEGKSLEKLARMDRGAAEEAARGVVPGKVREVELESENGFVVYEVEIAGEDGRLHEVIVDAGNGEVLGQEIEQDEGSEDDAY